MAEVLQQRSVQKTGAPPQKGGSLLIVTAGFNVNEALKRAFQEHMGLKKAITNKGISEIITAHNVEEAELALTRDTVQLALIQASIRNEASLELDGITLCKKMRLVNKARFPIIVTSFDKCLARRERIFDYPEDSDTKIGQYFLALPCLLEELQGKVESSKALEWYDRQAVVYRYCSPGEFVREKRRVIQHTLKHLEHLGGKPGEEREKYLQDLDRHIEELKKALGEHEALKILEEQREILRHLDPQALASEISFIVHRIGEALMGIQKGLEGIVYGEQPEDFGDR
jgi:hypothetical protein